MPIIKFPVCGSHHISRNLLKLIYSKKTMNEWNGMTFLDLE